MLQYKTLFSLCLCLFVSHIPRSVHAQAQCSGPTIMRREIRELIDPEDPNKLLPEGQAYIDGVQCLLRQSGSVAGTTVWDDFTQVHLDNAAAAHGTAAFLPWHRLFLVALERAMRQCTGNENIFVPYWDASLDSQAPERSVVWRFLGGNGRGSCIPNGPFANLRVQYSSPHCVARNFQSGSLPNTETVALYNYEQTYNSFRVTLESGSHTALHIWVGGDLPNMFSTNDPVFYLHHSNVDRQWARWQELNPRVANTYGGVSMNRGRAQETDMLDMTRISRYIQNMPVSAMYNIADWCYSYSNGVTPLTRTTTTTTTTATATTSSTTLSSSTTATTTTTATVTMDTPTDAILLPVPTDAITIPNDTSISTFFGSPNNQQSAAIPLRNTFWVNSVFGLFKRSWTDFFETDESEPVESTVNHGTLVKRHVKGRHGSPYNHITPPPDDRIDYYNLRPIPPIPKYVIDMNYMNETVVRKMEDVVNQYIQYINTVDGYVSPSALTWRFNEEGSDDTQYRPLTKEEVSSRYHSRKQLWEEARKQLGFQGATLGEIVGIAH